MKKMDQLKDYSGGGGLEDWLAFKARANYLNVLLSNSVVTVGEMRLHPLPTINEIYNQRWRKPSVQEISGNQKYLHD